MVSVGSDGRLVASSAYIRGSGVLSNKTTVVVSGDWSTVMSVLVFVPSVEPASNYSCGRELDESVW